MIIIPLGIIFVLIIVYYNRIKKFIYIFNKVNELPGKKGFPLIGNVLELWGPQGKWNIFLSALVVLKLNDGNMLRFYLKLKSMVIINDNFRQLLYMN